MAAGLAFVTRPDNVLLAPFVVALKRRNRFRALVIVSLCLLVPAVPWAAYCYHVGESLLPPTRTGKLLVFLPGAFVTVGAVRSGNTSIGMLRVTIVPPMSRPSAASSTIRRLFRLICISLSSMTSSPS